MNAENRTKVRQYIFERDDLNEFLEKSNSDLSYHVKHAVTLRLNTIEKELKILGGKR